MTKALLPFHPCVSALTLHMCQLVLLDVKAFLEAKQGVLVLSHLLIPLPDMRFVPL
jgi:hypothetical protein